MSYFRILILSVLFLQADFLKGQGIELTVEQGQSFATVTVLGASDVTSIDGNALIELDPVQGPFATAHLTELNVSLADGFNICLLGGAAEVIVEPGEASVSFVQVGAAGSVNADNQFDQVGNLFGVVGESTIASIFGDSVVDLATVKPVPFDIFGAQLDVDGETLTVFSEVDLDFEFEVLGGTAVMNLNGPLVMTGTLPSKVILGDVNCDGSVDLLDVGPFVDAITSGEFSQKADVNEDDEVNLLDVQPFIELLTGG